MVVYSFCMSLHMLVGHLRPSASLPFPLFGHAITTPFPPCCPNLAVVRSCPLLLPVTLTAYHALQRTASACGGGGDAEGGPASAQSLRHCTASFALTAYDRNSSPQTYEMVCIAFPEAVPDA
jgi:hypothetical protein